MYYNCATPASGGTGIQCCTTTVRGCPRPTITTQIVPIVATIAIGISAAG
jgi:hypothetical protein